MNKQRGFEVLPGFNATIPQRATSLSAGYDLKSNGYYSIAPGATALIDTGLTAYMQDDEELQIRSRSGLALKGIVVRNSPGTVDADYYGKHIKVILHNGSNDWCEVKENDRIAQAVFSKYLVTDDDQPAAQKRNGGFGHTGM